MKITREEAFQYLEIEVSTGLLLARRCAAVAPQ
jgi:hypothetical protein